MPKFLFFLVVILIALLCGYSPPSSVAANLCSPPDMYIDQRPERDGPPTEITMGVLVADIIGIDDVEQTITGDFIVELQWVDKRLENQAGCRFPVSKVWSPRLELLNSFILTTTRKFQKDQVEVKAGGRIHYYQRYFGSIATYHHLADFPFDKQQFKLRVTSTDYDINEINIIPEKDFTRVAELINIPDWTIGKVTANVEVIDMAELRSTRSVFILEIPAVRNSSFYIWKVLVPLVLIVMMSWVVFWINPVKFGPQLGLSATAMLTLIAFQFAQTGVFPKLSYFTTMDKLILGSSVLVFFSFFESALAINLVARDKGHTAVKLDLLCRWLFPLLFIAFWFVVLIF